MTDRLKLFIPLIIFVLLAVVFWTLLKREGYDPQYLPSALINKAVPSFQVASLEREEIVLDNAVLASGEPQLVNVWATWCISCRVEHPFLNQLAMQGISIVGVNYKDERVAALQWLEKLGNPYRENLYDVEGKLGLDLGVYGAPETYLIDGKGIVRLKHVGVVDDAVWKDVIEPVYRKYKGDN